MENNQEFINLCGDMKEHLVDIIQFLKGLKVERDKFFEPTRIAVLIDKHKNEGGQ